MEKLEAEVVPKNPREEQAAPKTLRGFDPQGSFQRILENASVAGTHRQQLPQKLRPLDLRPERFNPCRFIVEQRNECFVHVSV